MDTARLERNPANYARFVSWSSFVVRLRYTEIGQSLSAAALGEREVELGLGYDALRRRYSNAAASVAIRSRCYFPTRPR